MQGRRNPAPAAAKSPVELIVRLRRDVKRHLKKLQLPGANGNGQQPPSKDAIRSNHAYQRAQVLARETPVLLPYRDELIRNFANGTEIVPEMIDPEIVPVSSDDETGRLFRFACLLWSVPVSHGYGRRIRFLVRDRSNHRLIGIFALGDPVFNLQARDSWIGWNVDDRRARLVNVMDAYVLGAVPPYSQIIGGKLIASLIGSAEVGAHFAKKYRKSEGQISGEKKSPRLVLVTVTSALGRSSLYNRLKLSAEGKSLVELLRIGETKGYGHFQISDELFDRFRELLSSEHHPYAGGHKFGEGPNWRMRVTRVGLSRIGLDDELTRHGIIREIYAMPLAANFREFLRGDARTPLLDRPSASTIASAALARWIVPRAERDLSFREFRRDQLNSLLEAT